MIASIRNRKTLADLLHSAAEESPQRGIGFVRSDESIRFLDYQLLQKEAQKIAGSLQSRGLKKGSKAMIIMTGNEEIITTVWACFITGIVPTILQPPLSFSEFNQPAQKIINVFKTLDNPYVILSKNLRVIFNTMAIPEDLIIQFDELIKENENFIRVEILETDLAFIQFSSGSTGNPKGIMLNHENIITNLSAIGNGLELKDDDITTNWMPLYHDMGFIGFHLTPVYACSSHYIIDPIDFVKRPAIWLDVMDAVKCNITGCPNFGQALLLRFLKNREKGYWNLSCLKAIINGAEPISTRIMTDFLSVLSENKVNKSAMLPAYGMAEATLAITFFDLWKDPVINSFNRTKLIKFGEVELELNNPHEMVELVSVGRPLDNIEIKIEDDEGNIIPENQVGHIRIRGKSVTSGYINNPEATAEAFEDGWLKTGDKGFFYDGQLYITGRIKDIIFMHGQNLYAHDLENLASKHADIPYGKVIIGGSFDPKKGKDQVILFLVGSANQALCDLFLELKGFFRDTYGVHIDVFVPVRSNQVPKTSSGKIQRYKLLEDYRDGAFDEAMAEIRRLMR